MLTYVFILDGGNPPPQSQQGGIEIRNPFLPIHKGVLKFEKIFLKI